MQSNTGMGSGGKAAGEYSASARADHLVQGEAEMIRPRIAVVQRCSRPTAVCSATPAGPGGISAVGGGPEYTRTGLLPSTTADARAATGGNFGAGAEGSSGGKDHLMQGPGGIGPVAAGDYGPSVLGGSGGARGAGGANASGGPDHIVPSLSGLTAQPGAAGSGVTGSGAVFSGGGSGGGVGGGGEALGGSRGTGSQLGGTDHLAQGIGGIYPKTSQ